MNGYVYGAASRWAAKELGGTYDVVEDFISVDTDSIPVVAQNGNRVGLIVVNNGTTNITLKTRSPVVSGLGLLLLGNGSQMRLNYRDDLGLCEFPFYGIGDAIGGTLYVLQLLQVTPEEKDGE